MRTSAALLGLLLLPLGAGAARAESIPFTTLAQGDIGAPGAPANHVIRSEQQLRAAGVDRLLPPGTRIDWTNEIVIACLMGTKSTGGYSIEVTGLSRGFYSPPPQPGHPPPLGVMRLEVQVARGSPAPGAIVPKVVTSPFHVVKAPWIPGPMASAFVDAAPADEAKGVVRVAGGQVLLEESDHTSYRLQGPAAATARKFEGRQVTVAGRLLDPLPDAPVAGTVLRFEATALLRPTAATDAPIQVQPTGGAPNVHVQGQRVASTFGPAARVITRLGQGRTLLVDGFVFTDAQDLPEALYAERVLGKATADSILRRNGQFAGFARRGQTLEVLELSADGAQARVKVGARTGWMSAGRLEVGEVPVPLHGPVHGLTSAIPGQ